VYIFKIKRVLINVSKPAVKINCDINVILINKDTLMTVNFLLSNCNICRNISIESFARKIQQKYILMKKFILSFMKNKEKEKKQ